MATHDNVILCVPGILARCEEQHRPLHLERFAEVKYLDYGTNSFEDMIDQIMELTGSFHGQGRPVKLLGTSLGANVATFATHQMLKDGMPPDAPFKLVLVDGPAGSRTFVAAKSVPPGLIVSPIGSVIFSLIGSASIAISRRGPGLPKDEYITRPSDEIVHHLTGQSGFADEAWPEWVKSAAKEGLTGHSGRVWSKQIQAMTEWYESDTLDEATRSLEGIDAVYAQCVTGNDVIAQSQAWYWHMLRMGYYNEDDTPRWVTIGAPHCGYLQMQSEFETGLVPHLR